MSDEDSIVHAVPQRDELASFTDVSTGEVLSMVLGYEHDDITVGRMSHGLDPSDFDFLPPREVDLTEEHAEYLGEDEEKPGIFEEPAPEVFPVFKAALKHFQDQESKPRALRVDTEESYQHFASDKAVQEIDRRLRELRTAFEEHLDGHSGLKQRRQLSKWDEILGASEAIAKIHSASTADEAMDAMPKVPLDLAPAAEGSVKCWMQGDHVVCSIRFLTADGGKRIATMVAKPRFDEDEVISYAERSGIDPVTVLGILPDLAAVACGKKLVKDVAGAALKATRREDVCGMDNDHEPVLLIGGGAAQSTAPLAALMYVQQRADAGDEQAASELSVIERAAKTPSGRQIAAPMLSKARARLASSQSPKNLTMAQKHAQYALCL